MNLLFGPDSRICTRCWHAEDSSEPATWMRSSELPDSFVTPLVEAIRKFPAPPDSASFDQRFVGKHRMESLFFWCADSPNLIARFQNYCKQHELALDLKRSERLPKEVFVTVEHKPILRNPVVERAVPENLKSDESQKPRAEP